MQQFFRNVHQSDDPEQVAKKYAAYFWDQNAATLRDARSLDEQQFDVSLSFGARDLASITKRVSLVCDTLLFSDIRGGKYHEIGRSGPRYDPKVKHWVKSDHPGVNPADLPAQLHWTLMEQEERKREWREDYFGIRTLDLAQLGSWILEAEPLLRAGLAWYLPNYCLRTQWVKNGRPAGKPRSIHQAQAVDFLLQGRRAVEASGQVPVKSRIVRPILEIKLPFIEGVGLRDFSKITVDEFGSYDRFRNYLRTKFLELDQAHDAVQSELALTRIGEEIRAQIHECQAEMAKIHRTRSVAATGAFLGAAAATLTAVYGPALAAALGVVGATGGLWGVVQAVSQNSVRTIRDGKWYYIWTVDQAYEQGRAKSYARNQPKRSRTRY
ncbi:hypothetical protein ACIBG8_09590 [Nonomuraea sp. NPDC050556]|uniref:hypothetical protein n=1 Tax=Nonomuraea sp. NPDC050556 TaxID=3364369 RepID=UPI00379D0753